MATVLQSPKFLEKLIFDLLEPLLEYGFAAEGTNLRRNIEVIRVLRRAAEMTEGYPSAIVQEFYHEIFLRDLWEKLPRHERRPGLTRRFTADRLDWP